MTTQTEALKLALEAFQWIAFQPTTGAIQVRAIAEATAIKEALAQPEQEAAPVAKNEGGRITWMIDDWPQNCLLYTTPPQRDSSATPRTWVGLTDYQIEMTWLKHHDAEGYLRNPNQEGWAYEKELMAKLKEKNT